MLKIEEIKISRILNPTGIDLGEYVINPYRGCEFGCLYCYVRFNKNTINNPLAWGTYVDARINSIDLLEREIAEKQPKLVLLGSTTECFQPVEKRFHLSEKIIKILNNHKVCYNILTRSPSIIEYKEILKGEFCKNIYFTFNNYDQVFKKYFEPKSPDFGERIDAICELKSAGIPVVPYFSPVIPYISDFRGIWGELHKLDYIEFEFLNFNLGNIDEIVDIITNLRPDLENIYSRMQRDEKLFNRIWEEIRKELEDIASETGKKIKIHSHGFNAWFKNTYYNPSN